MDVSMRGNHHAERAPLISKRDDPSVVEAYTANPRNAKTTNEKFVGVLIIGSVVFILTIYFVYSTFVVGNMRCSSGEGNLIVNNVYLSDLKNAELFKALDSNDPYVEMQFDNKRHETSVFESAGDEAVWENLGLIFDISQNSLDMDHELHVAVIDKNMVLKDANIGKTRIPISRYVSTITKKIQHFTIPGPGDGKDTIDMVDNNNRMQGKLKIDFDLKCKGGSAPGRRIRQR